eukprot:114728-Rhodomonas_salina.1
MPPSFLPYSSPILLSPFSSQDLSTVHCPAELSTLHTAQDISTRQQHSTLHNRLQHHTLHNSSTQHHKQHSSAGTARGDSATQTLACLPPASPPATSTPCIASWQQHHLCQQQTVHEILQRPPTWSICNTPLTVVGLYRKYSATTWSVRVIQMVHSGK